MLDYTAPSTILGKPTNADLALGLATAPVLFAWRDYPELGPMIKRKFEEDGDVERVLRQMNMSTDYRRESW
jgi:hexaprenyl-diphosphate synthase